MAEHHDRPVIDRELAEATLQLIPIIDKSECVPGRRLVSCKHAEIHRPTSVLSALRVASADEESIRPGVKARRIAKVRKVLPDAEQRLLRRILGEAEVAQDPARHGQEPIAYLGGELGKRLPVTALGSKDEIGIHGPLPT